LLRKILERVKDGENYIPRRFVGLLTLKNQIRQVSSINKIRNVYKIIFVKPDKET
jgi:hypothetical protein